MGRIYVCIAWEDEGENYNSVPLSYIQDTEKDPILLLGKVVDVLWEDEIHQGRVIGQGVLILKYFTQTC